MNNIIISSGGKYIDIDAYAGCIAYAILLRDSNIPAIAVSTAPLNESIPELIKRIGLSFDDYIPTANDEFIVIDISDPMMFDSVIKINKIIGIIDHHTGFEEYWKQKIDKSEIEFIGSVCTIIYEKFVSCNKIHLLTPDLCKLLTAAILDNTLNLKANITTERDIIAYNELMKIGQLNDHWAQEYFDACEAEILGNLKTSIINDIKDTTINENLPDTFGQLMVFNSNKVLSQRDIIREVFSSYDNWMINIISLIDGKSYIISECNKAKEILSNLFGETFDGDVLVLDKFMLRKEIIKKAAEHHTK